MKCFFGKSCRFLMAIAVGSTLGISSMANADTPAELKEQIQVLQKKVDDLEKKSSQPAGTPGGFIVPGTNIELQFGGYTKLDIIYNSISTGDASVADQYFVPNVIPFKSQVHENDQLVFNARQSRLFFGSKSDTPYGKFKTYIETDFFGYSAGASDQDVSNSYGIRLRHAYGEMGNILVGQTWSTFINAGTIPDTVDFGGPAGQLFIRQAQLRYTQPFSWGSIQIAAENPETTSITVADNKTYSYDDDQSPDFVGRINLNQKWGAFSLAGIARRLSVDTGITSDETWGGGVTLSGKIQILEKDDLKFQVNYGNALGRYMYTGFRDVLDKSTAAEAEIDTYEQFGGFIAYRHFWMPTLRSSIMYGYGEANNDMKVMSASVNKKVQSFHTNIIWNPIKQINVGLEYLWAQREIESGDTADLNRVQCGFQYDFF